MNIFEEYKNKLITIIEKAEKDKLLILPENLNNVNVDSTPPKIDFDNLISPPCERTISLAIVMPSPLSPFNLFLLILLDLYMSGIAGVLF